MTTITTKIKSKFDREAHHFSTEDNNLPSITDQSGNISKLDLVHALITGSIQANSSKNYGQQIIANSQIESIESIELASIKQFDEVVYPELVSEVQKLKPIQEKIVSSSFSESVTPASITPDSNQI